jgi:hypothetical protein
MNKLDLGRMLVTAVILSLFLCDAVSVLWSKGVRLPDNHKQVLLTGTLLLISTLFFNQKRDDDWAGLL